MRRQNAGLPAADRYGRPRPQMGADGRPRMAGIEPAFRHLHLHDDDDDIAHGLIGARGGARAFVHDARRRDNPPPRPQQGRGGGPHRPAGGGQGRGGNRPQPGGFRPLEVNLSFHRLRELEPKEPAEVVAALSYSKEGLTRLLANQHKLTTDPAMVRLLLACLVKVSQCQSMPAQQIEILNIVKESDFFDHLGTFLAAPSSAEELAQAIGDSADLLKTLVERFPSHLHKILMVQGFMDIAVKQANRYGTRELPAEVARRLELYEDARDAAVEGLQRRQARNRGVVQNEDSLTPPDDFREISVFPTARDLDKETLPFLRKNKYHGGYMDVDHYLDVQFRLLREDFVCPLREGIAEYVAMLRAPQAGKRLTDIRVYHEVRILKAICLTSGLGHRLTFDLTGLGRVRWEVSKRLIYGSLVCLSADNFGTLYFATITNREPADLKRGEVDVVFEHDLQQISTLPPETTFTMAETTAFFEAYRHVLAGLQNIRDTTMPFQKYIVSCENQVSPPKYLADARRTSYDLRPLVDDNVMLREDQRLLDQGREVPYLFSQRSKPAESVTVLNRHDWPDPKLLGLDRSQFDALHCALTNEFSVIQGPPGTGKTYVGLKIVKALLHNRRAWDPHLDSCMLVVCYTNHALDQFLEEVVSFFDGQVVRVGSRIRSEKLEPYSLSNLRYKFRGKRDGVDRFFREITRLRFQGHDAMEILKGQVDSKGMKIETAKREIVNEDVLMPYMLHRHYQALEEQKPLIQGHASGFVTQGRTRRRVFCIPTWLGIDGVVNNAEMTMEDLQQLEQDLLEEGEMDIEGDIQAMEEQNRLDTDDTFGKGNWQQKERERKQQLAEERSTYLAVDLSGLDDGQDHQGGQGGFQFPRAQRKRWKQQLRRKVASHDHMTELEEQRVRNVWLLEMPQRWRLYRLWTHKLCQDLQDDLHRKEQEYDELAKRHRETLMQEDKHIMKSATVIAMTTTAAARYQSVLQEVKPRVVVVEEAAEVLEGHVITTLSAECQHLILIGDHKQLRPNPTVFALARKYNLELSLFERMINNDLKCNTLGWQHRMRPEIAALVKPIYPDLNNHPSVERYEAVKGVSSNLFFIKHNEPEARDAETKSHSNVYEARYLARLCLYLLQQGYEPSKITVLTTYSGQLFQLRKLMPKKSMYDGVRVTVVDNFQGEENDIILLSLVRSNEHGKIGFLKTENRVCVALSRAKVGLYVIANFDLLSSQCDLWQRITARLETEGRIGEALSLYCQNHPRDTGLVVRTPDDFKSAPEGGCMKPCTARLDCGHVCAKTCHTLDKDHEDYKCRKTCDRQLACEFRHRCKKQCHEKCGTCTERVQRTITRCGHTQWMDCADHPDTFLCREKCSAVLECGHMCGEVCGAKHQCLERVERTWGCGHKGQVMCKDKDIARCPSTCGQQLQCGHGCAGTCVTCHNGRLHKKCKNRCARILVCGHECGDTCSNCPPCEKKCENSCVHSSCQLRCGLPCTPCMERCSWCCPHFRCTKLCSEPCDRPRCPLPCPKTLKCGHPCIGLCGETCPKLCRVCNEDKVTEIFFGSEDEPDARFVQLEDCEHIVEVTALDQWMTTTTDSKEDSVQLKSCPVCKTAIRRNLRYGAIIKSQLNDIEVIKRRLVGDEAKNRETLANLVRSAKMETGPHFKLKKTEILTAGDKQTAGGLVAMDNQMKLLDEVKKLHRDRRKAAQDLQRVKAAINKFEEWVCQPRLVFSQQETENAQTEVLRLRHWIALTGFITAVVERNVPLPSSVIQLTNDMLSKMVAGHVYSQKEQDVTRILLKQLEKLVPRTGLGVSEAERVMILQAMQLTKGHWFKCPKGHIYAIGDCGGATEESRCPECSSAIGGSQHRLRDDNRLATEMDGARHAAWSEHTNLANFRIDHLL